MVDESLSQRIGAALRRERTRCGLSVSELARRAGVSKATVSQLENGQSNPGVETLWALCVVLGVPFSVLVEPDADGPTLIRASDTTPVAAESGDYSAALLSASPPGARRDIYLVRARPGEPRLSEPHQRGTIEHVVLLTGRADVGPAHAPVTLEPGDYLSYPGDAPHVFRAVRGDTAAVLVSELR